MKFYLVGGMVRDKHMGIKSKDADFSVVIEHTDMAAAGTTIEPQDPFDVMRRELVRRGFKIFVETPEHLTIRAQFPKGDNSFGTRDADFVLARKDGDYSDGRRPDSVTAGTLEDDLRRRDFTMNAIAQDEDGNFIDPFDGIADINDGVIRAVGTAYERLSEDALRAVRAIRFAVTKEFRIDFELRLAMEHKNILDKVASPIVADERIKDEVAKMVRHDTVASIRMFNEFPALTNAMFSGRVSLDSTMKTKGRGKA